jgi:crotonobetainyl-CoA:carnitine CoA-transferase CaiB-like acyl-CoA transferase
MDVFWHSAVAIIFTFQMVERPEDAFTSPQLEFRGYQVDVSHPRIGTVKLPGDTYGLSETPWHVRRRAPLLGEHNAEVYGELGYSHEQLSRLRESGVI